MKIALLGPYPAEILSGQTSPPLAGGVDAVVVALAAGLAQHPAIALSVITAVPGLAQPTAQPLPGFTLYGVPRPRGGGCWANGL